MAGSGNYTVRVYPIIDPSKLRDQLNGLGTKAGGKELGKKMGNQMGDSLADNMVRAVKRKISYGLLNVISRGVEQGLRSMVNNVVELDKSQVELAKVTDLSGKSMDEFTDKAFKAGEAVAKTGKEMVDATTEFAKSGYGDDPDTALGLARVATLYQNISDEEISAGEAANFIIAQMKAFGFEGEEGAMRVIDAVNEVSNNFAVSSGDIANNLGKASSAARNAGMSYEELIGIMTGMTEINRNAAKSARSVVTLSSRYNQMTDSASSTGNKLTEFYNELGIKTRNADGQLIDFYKVLDQMGNKWDTLTDDQKKYYANIQAGANQSQNLIAVLDNWKNASEAMKTAMEKNSDGSAMRENEKYLDSVEGKLNKLRTAWQKLSKDFMSSDFLKGILDVATRAVDAIDFLVEHIGGVPVALTTAFAGFRISGALLGGMVDEAGLNKLILRLGNALFGEKAMGVFHGEGGRAGKKITEGIEDGLEKSAKNTTKGVKKVTEEIAEEVAEGSAEVATASGGVFATIGTKLTALKASLAGVAPILAGITIAAVAVGGALAWGDYISFDKSVERLKNYQGELDKTQARIDELIAKKASDGGLSNNEERELKLLQLQTKELEKQIALEEYRAKKAGAKKLSEGSGKMNGERAGTANSAQYDIASAKLKDAEKKYADYYKKRMKAQQQLNDLEKEGKDTTGVEAQIKTYDKLLQNLDSDIIKYDADRTKYATKAYEEWQNLMEQGINYQYIKDTYGVNSKEMESYQALRKSVLTMTLDNDKLKDSYEEVASSAETAFDLFKEGITVDNIDLSGVEDTADAIQEILDNVDPNQTITIDCKDETGKVIGDINAQVKDLTDEQWQAVIEATKTGDWSEVEKFANNPELQEKIHFRADGINEVKTEVDSVSDKQGTITYTGKGLTTIKSDVKEVTKKRTTTLSFVGSGLNSIANKIASLSSKASSIGKFATGKSKGQAGGLAWLGDEGSL